VGTNATRLEIARAQADGSFEVLIQERDPIRPGEGVFASGSIRREVADRLVGVLRRYGALCRRFGAEYRAVATSALREAKNRHEVVRRIRREAGIDLEIISGPEEARLICVGVLSDRPSWARSLVIDIGGGSTEVARASGPNPVQVWSLDLGAVRLSEIFNSKGSVTKKQLELMRAFVAQMLEETLPRSAGHGLTRAFGSSGTIKSLVLFAADQPTATGRQLSRAAEKLAALPPERRRKRFDAHRADIIVTGAVILEGLVHHLHLQEVVAVEQGLRDGLILDLWRRSRQTTDHLPADAAHAFARRFGADEKHSKQVTGLALQIFDGLAPLHRLPSAARPLLELASILHDVGNAVSYQRHHRHSQYLIQNADLPGLSSHERDLVARIARFHRRSAPQPGHAGMEGLSAADARLVKRLAAILRVADAFDRSHRQPVRSVRAILGKRVRLQLRARGPVDLELWDAHQELPLLIDALGRRVDVEVA
jgi:exopolyphosphatase/guanosine-5'-triphosphate,3'-diphosphate pyrophosphatase